MTYDFDAIPPSLRNPVTRSTGRGRPRSSDGNQAAHSRPPPSLSFPSSPSNSRRRMRSVLRRIRENEGSIPSAFGLPALNIHRPTDSMAPPARRRAQPSTRFQHLSAHRARGAPSTASPSFEELAQLARINEVDSQHRQKRRRIDDRRHPKANRLSSVRYGYYGQARAGPLRMEIPHVNNGYTITNFTSNPIRASDKVPREPSIKHILQDGPTSFITQSRRLNIVLQHHDRRQFTIERIVIRLPGGSEIGPPLHGLVFRSFDMDNIFKETASYMIHNFATSRFGPRATHLTEFTQSGENPDGDPTDCPVNGSPHLSGIEDHEQCLRYRLPTMSPSDGHDSDSDAVYESQRPSDLITSRGSREESLLSDTDSEFDFPDLGSSLHRWLHWTHSASRGQSEEDSQCKQDPSPYFDDDDEDEDIMDRQFDYDESLQIVPDVASAHAQTLEGHLNSSSTLLSDINRLSSARLGTIQRQSNEALQAIEPPANATVSRYTPDFHHPRQSYALLEPSAFFTTERRRRVRYSISGARPVPAYRPPGSPPYHAAGDPDSGLAAPALPGSARIESSYELKESGGRVSITFNPPLSARYILLKLWRSHWDRCHRHLEQYGDQREHVEISRVKVYGWCGPRFFPAIEMA